MKTKKKTVIGRPPLKVKNTSIRITLPTTDLKKCLAHKNKYGGTVAGAAAFYFQKGIKSR